MNTLLLVEDEDDTRELLARALTRAGYACKLARSAREALTHARYAAALDLVISDIVLGNDERAGLDLVAALAAQGQTAPVIMMTAYADVDKVKSALNAGVRHFLEKPFSASALVEQVALVLADTGSVARGAERIFARALLTEKERTVALHLLEGRSSSEIAALESNSPKTIRQHVSQIYAKCGVGSRAEFFRLVYVR